MRILAVSHLFPTEDDPRYGIFVARQLAEIARQSEEITVLVPRTWCPAPLRRFERWQRHDHHAALRRFPGLDPVAVPYVRPPGNWFNRWSGLVVARAAQRTARELHARRGFDIIYASDFFPGGDAAVRLGHDLGIPAACLGVGVDVNDTPHTTATMHRHFVRTARALDATLACGRSVADAIEAVTGRDSLVVYGVLDLDEFTPVSDPAPARAELGLPTDGRIALYAGYLHRRKGVYELIDAMARVQAAHPGVMLALCGGGSEEAGLRVLARERGVSVHFAGEVDPGRMRTWMQAATVFVLASHTEGVPNVLLEAMACGLPAVATAVGGVPGAVGDCEGVVLVPPRNVDALARALDAVLSDGERRSRMGAASRARAEEAFGVTRNAGRILDYLGTVVERRRSSRASTGDSA